MDKFSTVKGVKVTSCKRRHALRVKMKTPGDTKFTEQVRKMVESGHNVDESKCALIPNSVEELQEMLHCCSYYKRNFPKQFLKGMLYLRLKKKEFYGQLFKGITSMEAATSLEAAMEKISRPSQLIWGKQDELIHHSGVEVLSAGLPDCQQVVILDRCGHVIHVDRPGAFAKAILEFRGELHTAKHKKYAKKDQ